MSAPKAAQPAPAVTPHLPIIYGVMHALVDATCALALYSALRVHDIIDATSAFAIILTYDFVAFGGQSLVGLVTDRWRLPRAMLALGLILPALALPLIAVEPWAAAICAGVGNACFHVGAGAFVLSLEPRRATPAGLFVAPGALGLTAGILLGRHGALSGTPLVLLSSGVAVCALLSLWVAFRVQNPVMPYGEVALDRTAGSKGAVSGIAGRLGLLIVGLLLVSITVRSIVGMGGCHHCPKATGFLVALTLAAFAGKALGGVLADRFGWIETSVGALLLSAPFIAFGSPWAVLIGLFVFQLTMPVTLVAILQVMPRRPGLAFGLPCFALIAGAAPGFWKLPNPWYGPGFFVLLILLSALAAFFGLRLLGARSPSPRRVAWLYGPEGPAAS